MVCEKEHRLYISTEEALKSLVIAEFEEKQKWPAAYIEIGSFRPKEEVLNAILWRLIPVLML